MKRCVKCHNKISYEASRCGMCRRPTSTVMAYRWHILLAMLATGAVAGLRAIL